MATPGFFVVALAVLVTLTTALGTLPASSPTGLSVPSSKETTR